MHTVDSDILRPHREREAGPGALAKPGLDPQVASRPFNNLLADRQTNTGSLILVTMEALEDPEHLFEVFRVDV
jgi:hypothetical protein